MLFVSAIAALGGLVMYWLVPDGPYLRAGAGFDPIAFAAIFRSPDFRASSFGYFGHMWELYAFWAFVPVYLSAQAGPQTAASSVSLWSFLIIGAGAVGCVLGGLLSRRYGSAKIAFFQLAASGLCCLVSPLAFWLPQPAAMAVLVFWGIVVVGDSPQFSALNARYAPPHLVGSALTIVNCIGFAITILSIQLLKGALPIVGAQYLFLLLIPGPLLGLLALQRLVRRSGSTHRKCEGLNFRIGSTRDLQRDEAMSALGGRSGRLAPSVVKATDQRTHGRRPPFDATADLR